MSEYVICIRTNTKCAHTYSKIHFRTEKTTRFVTVSEPTSMDNLLCGLLLSGYNTAICAPCWRTIWLRKLLDGRYNTANHASSMQAGAAWSAESQPLRGSIFVFSTRLPKRFWARLREPKRQSMIQRPRFTVTGRGRAYRASEMSSARSNLFLLPSLTDSFTTSHSKSVQTRTPSTTSALSDNLA